jgi:hypothetical protein
VQLDKLREKDMSTITAEQARNITVFVITNYVKIEETTLFDHVMGSAEKTTSPRGVEHKLFVTPGDADDELGWFLKEWQRNGKSQIVSRYDSEGAAEEAKFQRIWKYDFLEDDQRDTEYWHEREGAEAVVNERLNEQ